MYWEIRSDLNSHLGKPTENRKEKEMSNTTQTKKNMRLAMAVIINSRESEEYNLKGLARSVWDVYEKHQVPDGYASFNALYEAAKGIANYKMLVTLKDPRADETIAQYAERQIALDLAKGSSLYSAAKDAFELFRRLGVKGGYKTAKKLIINLYRSKKGKIIPQL